MDEIEKLGVLAASSAVLVVLVASLVIFSGVLSSNPYDFQPLGYEPLYLRDNLPTQGQDVGKGNDVGSLVLAPPSDNEYRFCSQWAQFDYDAERDYMPLENFYLHFWWTYKSFSDQKFDSDLNVGWSFDEDYLYNRYTEENELVFSKPEHSVISHGLGDNSPVATVDEDYPWMYPQHKKSGVSLSVVMFRDLDLDEENVFSFSIKFEGNMSPAVLSSPHLSSFAIFNVPDNDTLRGKDSDSDGLNDYEELYVKYTDPFDGDTDEDGVFDSSDPEPNRHGIK